MQLRELQEEDSNEQYLVILTLVVSSLSFAGSMFIVATHTYFKSIRNFAFRLIFHLTLAEIISTVARFISVSQYKKPSNKLCLIEAVFTNYGDLSSILWTMLISYTIHLTVAKSSQADLKNKMNLFRFIGFGLPIFMTAAPVFTQQFGKSGRYCWIKEQDGATSHLIPMQLIQFYLPYSIAVVINLVLVCKALRKLQSTVSTSIEKRMVMRLRLYPLILVGCWGLGVINRIYNSNGKYSLVLDALQIVSVGLQGFFNALVYGATSTVRQVYMMKCGQYSFCCCCACCQGVDDERELDRIRLRDSVDKKDSGLEIDMKDVRDLSGDMSLASSSKRNF